jgi:hypothetical protein
MVVVLDQTAVFFEQSIVFEFELLSFSDLDLEER